MAIIAVILTLAVIGTVFLLLPENTETDETKISADTDGDGEITYRDYNGKRIGIKTGSSFEPSFWARDFLRKKSKRRF